MAPHMPFLYLERLANMSESAFSSAINHQESGKSHKILIAIVISIILLLH
ncbi:hypothetical protein ABIE26_004358 [Pedobacter africanus]|uniref:Uncharacterized protein n=1 Tax=Pedobacter africanus TaxID=151894 RepID=A0ACC6L2P2_9SPHI|nr:hypothetical protein [Pedobacter africanus]